MAPLSHGLLFLLPLILLNDDSHRTPDYAAAEPTFSRTAALNLSRHQEKPSPVKNARSVLRYATSALALLACIHAAGQTSAATPPPPPAPTSTLPVSINLYERSRTDIVNFFQDDPYNYQYPYVEQLLRLSVSQKIERVDWQLEVSENNVLNVPSTAVDPVAARGQLFLGGTYYAANAGNTLPVAASFKTGFLRYHGSGPDTSIRIGRFEFFDGVETTPRNPTLAWLQTNRIQQHLIGNFGFSNAQRSFDGADAHYGRGTWDITAMAARPTQGVFDMNANPELNVDTQYLAYTKRNFKDHLIVRTFAIGYHDGRTGLTKTDNRTPGARALDHKNIRIGTYGADLFTAIPAGPGAFDFLFWGALQNGKWGRLNQHAGALALEGGYRLTSIASKPWLRGGMWRATGDNNPTDNQHNTFSILLPTPRVYARFPFYDLQNSSDQFIQLVDSPSKKLDLRTDLHFLQQTAAKDLWYQGGGAFDNKVFGFTGRSAAGKSSFASVYDISSDYAVTSSFNLNLYYAHAFGKSVLTADFPQGHAADFGFIELVYNFTRKQKPTVQKN